MQNKLKQNELLDPAVK